MKHLITTLGLVRQEDSGLILPHEHVFVDLRNWREQGYATARVEDVVGLMKPELERARLGGVFAIVECSPIGVGRRADLLRAVSEASGFPLVVPTGVYREPWMPEWVVQSSPEALSDWMLGELTGEIEASGVQAAWIKLSAGDEGMTENEIKVLESAARAGIRTHALIGSHTLKGSVVREQLDRIERVGYSPERFLWIHAQAEPEFELNLEMAERGAWIEYDSIGSPEQDAICLDRVVWMVGRGFAGQVLISQDRGWYDPAIPGGGIPKPYTHLVDVFLPKLRLAGVAEETIHMMTVDNPFRAFAR
jgi:phosphotriesterase-related protein